MSEPMKVKIAGTTFEITAEACDALSNYVATLERAYAATVEGGEIVADIEARIVELILEKQKADEVVEKPLIDTIIATLGYPEGCDNTESYHQTHKGSTQATQSAKNQGCLYALGGFVGFCLKALAWKVEFAFLF